MGELMKNNIKAQAVILDGEMIVVDKKTGTAV